MLSHDEPTNDLDARREPACVRHLIDFCPRKGVLIARAATDLDHDRGVDTFESYDPALNEVQEWICIAEAEHHEVIDEDTANDMRAQMEVVKRPARVGEAA
jgi:hypothetical protein